MSNNIKQQSGPPLPGWETEANLARRKGVSQRTATRIFRTGGAEYLEWGGQIWLNPVSVDRVIEARIKQQNPPRGARRRGTR